MTGALRGIAQTISYEISLALLILLILVYLSLINLDSIIKIKAYYRFLLTAPFLLRL
jgi:NADH:ubiquinone oxidoreductase subunit H